ncbi:DUF2637 domain-containing protein, partial [Streptomyces goshikiensis]
MQLTRTHRILIGVVVAGAVVIAGIGFAGSYAAVRALALQKGFGTFSLVFPIGIDMGICVLLALDLLLTWIRIPFPLLRQTAWLLTAATIAFNGAAAWPDPLGVGMHAVIPVLFVVTVEAARHAVGRIADITADRHMEGVRITRWLLSPLPTFKLWRRMKLWELRSYEQAVGMEQDRLIYQARLQARYGRAWRRKAPVEALMPLRLARIGVPLSQTAPEGLAAAGIDPLLLPPSAHALAGRDETTDQPGSHPGQPETNQADGQGQLLSQLALQAKAQGQTDGQLAEQLARLANAQGQLAGQTDGQLAEQIARLTNAQGQLAGHADGQAQAQGQLLNQLALQADGQGQPNGQLAEQLARLTNAQGQPNGQLVEQLARLANAQGQADGQLAEQIARLASAQGQPVGQANGQLAGPGQGQFPSRLLGQPDGQGPGQMAGQANGQGPEQFAGQAHAAFAVDPTAMPAAHNSAWFAGPLAPQASYEGGYNPQYVEGLEPTPVMPPAGPDEDLPQQELPVPPADEDADADADEGFDDVKFAEAAYEVF